MRTALRRSAGFTLVEIMVTVAIIGMVAGISVPNAFKARETAQLNNILNNLRIFEESKSQWALENRKGTWDIPSDTDLAAYMKGNALPVTVVGEFYFPADVGTPTTAKLPATVSLGEIPAGGTITSF
jgi:prepilin-type N-terminal cleavage/methylation domain-containing protein